METGRLSRFFSSAWMAVSINCRSGSIRMASPVASVSLPGRSFHWVMARLAKRARGETSPNPLVGAVLAKRGNIIGRGWHRRAGLPHAEVEAIADAKRKGNPTKGATLYVTLEPCSTSGRTPPCTHAIIKAGISRVVVAATDPNPEHAGRAFRWLKRKGIAVEHGLLTAEAAEIEWMEAAEALETANASSAAS